MAAYNPDRENRIRAELEKGLSRYLSANQIDFISAYFIDYPLHLKIIPQRKSFKGLCRLPNKEGERFIISVSVNEISALFFLVFLHEIAHMVVHRKYGRKISTSHGHEWGETFGNLIKESLTKSCFTNSETEIITSFILKNPKITNHSMHKLERNIVNFYNPDIVRLSSLPDNAVFKIASGMEFKLISRMRSYYLCNDIKTGRKYKVHSELEVVSWKSE